MPANTMMRVRTPTTIAASRILDDCLAVAPAVALLLLPAAVVDTTAVSVVEVAVVVVMVVVWETEVLLLLVLLLLLLLEVGVVVVTESVSGSFVVVVVSGGGGVGGGGSVVQGASSHTCRCTVCVGQGMPPPCAGCSTHKTRTLSPTPQLTLQGPHGSHCQMQSVGTSGGISGCRWCSYQAI